MSLEKFDQLGKKQSTSLELSKLVGDVFTTGMEEFSKTLGRNFSPPKDGKWQITREIDQRENQLIAERSSV